MEYCDSVPDGSPMGQNEPANTPLALMSEPIGDKNRSGSEKGRVLVGDVAGREPTSKGEKETLKMEAICSSETSVDFQRTTRRYITEDRTLHNLQLANLHSQNFNQLGLPGASDKYLCFSRHCSLNLCRYKEYSNVDNVYKCG
jgi:hypothetical protein